MHDAQVFQSRDARGDRLALSYSTARESDDWTVISEENEPDRFEPASAYEQFLASYDYRAHRADEFQKIQTPYVSYAASGWANDSLLLISEVPNPAISVYQ